MSHAEIQALLSNSAWVRRLAERLVGDPNQADDLVQETWLAALRHRSGPLRSDRAFLSAVLRRLAWQRLRSDGRRDAREQASARPEEIPSTAELVERMAAHRRVVEAVMQLPEIYRDVVLRRYFEGEMPAAIAAHLELPVSTVKTRLQRGLAQLRQELDGEFGGDGKSWIAGLAPLLRTRREPPLAAPPVAGGLALTALAVLAPLAVVGFALWGASRRDAQRQVAVAPTAPAPGADDPVADAARAPVARARRDAFSPAALAVGPEREDAQELDRAFVAARRTIAGRVVGVDGAAVAGVLLRFEPLARVGAEAEDREGEGGSDAIALSSGDGRFELRGARGAGAVTPLGPEHVALAPARVGAREAPRDLVIVVAPARAVPELEGRVVETAGEPVRGARVTLALEAPLGGLVGASLERAAPFVFATETGADGRFAFADAARVELVLRASAPGFEPVEVELEPDARGPFELCLAPTTSAGGVTGRVLDPRGVPVAGALVSYGDLAVRTDAGGAFDVEARDARLVAFREPYGPAFATPEDGRFPEPLELRLLPEPLVLSGVVRDAAGSPLGGVAVWLDDPTLLALPEPVPEDERRESTRFSLPDDDAPSTFPLPSVAEALLAGRPHRPWTAVRTDAEGRFAIAGLGDRPYRLALLDEARLQMHLRGPFRPADGPLDLALERAPARERLVGRVVDSRGSPVAGVRAQLFRHVQALRHDGRQLLGRMVRGGSAITDPEGRFVLRDVPEDPEGEVRLDLDGPAILPSVHELGRADGELEVVVARSASLSVTLLDPAEAEAFELLDERGDVLPVFLRRAGIERTHTRAPLVDGRSEVLRAPARASAIRLLRGDAVVREAPLHLDATGPNDVRL